MTVLLTSTEIVPGLRTSDSNARSGIALPINLHHRESRSFERCRSTQSRRTAFEQWPLAETNCLLLAAVDPASPATVTDPATIPIVPNLPQLRSIRLL